MRVLVACEESQTVMSLIEREKLLEHLDACLAESDGGTPITDAVLVAIRCAVEQMPEVDAVPTDFHDRCMQAEIQKRIELEKNAGMLCDGYLDMPCGCDGCPLVDTMVEDDDGNGVCDLYRR